MEEKLKLSDYAVLCSQFEEQPDNIELLNKISDFLSKLVVKEYLPLKQKEIVVVNILTTLNKDYDAAGVAAFLEIGKVTTALLSYCVNLEVDITPLVVGYYLIDIIYKYGLYKTVYDVCHDDCVRLFNMIDNSVNVSNIYRLLETASLFDTESYDRWLNSMKDLKDTLDSQTLKDMLKVVDVYGDKDGDLTSQLTQMAMEAVKAEYQAEAQKFEKAMKAQASPKIDDNLGEK